MSEYVIALYANHLLKLWECFISQKDLFDLLYGAVVKPLNLEGDNGELIECTPTSASRILSRQENVHSKIRANYNNAKVRATIVPYFEKEVAPHILSGQEDVLIYRIMLDIAASNLPPERIAEFNDLAKLETLERFLAEAYLESLVLPNKVKPQKKKDSGAQSMGAIAPPDDIAAVERGYVRALLDVYAEAEGLSFGSFTVESFDDYPEREGHFRRQRGDFYAAEAIRRGTRDIYNVTEADPFVELVDEVYSEVVETYERVHDDDYAGGLSCLRTVLDRAMQIDSTNLMLAKDGYRISNSQRKGVCHFLINDGRIEGWARADR
ncbi:ABC-three component system protein [Gordonibacter sp. Marseille-P4307]|uniref:ABC-three component system protein n=1 Tax=Gordonibacter sp. Marseille-P4307 TaxID=2161815 RepID=UPI000F5282EF|nr:ABC-three component system protein [Gordonibacter sp. Marseille-P4307]